ncbi:hypothetical protein IW492_04875 [Enterococcus sp. BWB1-3]|uniref:hypothetical protein n=1 Tax=unclassified Enterococcus TaxID=2608891 RepID=UPI0019240EEC|nr:MULTISPECIES: hypothetical protein [unclassified Enterococcus]MBL1228566.1 hypothetical protein [Enterococcus sp. BWB1-3]MCB5950571.1 hypothetical protein [Enterococcus sp. BWT-B8]MCB5955896.1 hypothetical protein [Enterococcus sp. CWB-B31]
MEKISLETDEMALLKNRLMSISVKVNEISCGGYVTEHLFTQSQGQATEMLNQCLAILVKGADELQLITDKSIRFLEEIIEGFTETDQVQAKKITGE